MKSSMRFLAAAALLATGYFLGNVQISTVANAQPEESIPSDDAIKKIRDVNTALKNAVIQLKTESKYESVTKDINSFAVLVGGIDVKEDLESGHGVDPESFAALNVLMYDLKKNNIKDDSLADWVDHNQFSYDADGLLMYKGKILRIYSISKLRRLNAQRHVVLEETKKNKS